MKGKITKRSVESIASGRRDVFLWATDIPGFGVKVTPSRKRVYVLHYPFGAPPLPSTRLVQRSRCPARFDTNVSD